MNTFIRATAICMLFYLTLVFCPSINAQKSAELTSSSGEQIDNYGLNPGDVIEVRYRYTPEFNQTVTILPDGSVTLDLIGSLKLANLTIEQARTAILQKSAEVLQDPEVSLILRDFQKPYFVIAGEVVNPGRYDMREKTTALQAVMLAGGFRDTAKASRILVFRKVNTEFAEMRAVNLNKINKTNKLEQDIMLSPGDMILVPQNTLTKIERFVKLVSIGGYFIPFLK